MPGQVLKVLDLFAGLKGWSEPFENAGHDVRTLDVDGEFGCTYTVDIREFAAKPDKWLNGWRPDVVLLSPPCNAFTLMCIGRMFKRDGGVYRPKHRTAWDGVELLDCGLRVVESLKPRWWIMENPRAVMRKWLAQMYPNAPSPVTVVYCQYGERRMKPTDLWGKFPPSWRPRPMCKRGDSCHEAAPRPVNHQPGVVYGGTFEVGSTPASRAKIPHDLADSFRVACEQDSS